MSCESTRAELRLDPRAIADIATEICRGSHGQLEAKPLSQTLCVVLRQDMIRFSIDDPELGMTFRKVGHMVSPPEALFAPGVLGKVLYYRLRRLLRRLSPQQDAAPAPSYVE